MRSRGEHPAPSPSALQHGFSHLWNLHGVLPRTTKPASEPQEPEESRALQRGAATRRAPPWLAGQPEVPLVFSERWPGKTCSGPPRCAESSGNLQPSLGHTGAVPPPSRVHVTARGEHRTQAAQLGALLCSSPIPPAVLEEAKLLGKQRLPRVRQANSVLGAGALVPSAPPAAACPGALSCRGAANFMRCWGHGNTLSPSLVSPEQTDGTRLLGLVLPLRTQREGVCRTLPRGGCPSLSEASGQQ